MGQQPSRAAILASLEDLSKRVARGDRLRLLCHCRPHVRCHTEYLKAHIELRATELGWDPTGNMHPAAPVDAYSRWEEVWPLPTNGEGFLCAALCGRIARAMDPLSG